MKKSNKGLDLIWRDRERTVDWLQEMKNVGEVGASQYAVDEAIRISSDPSYSPCEITW